MPAPLPSILPTVLVVVTHLLIPLLFLGGSDPAAPMTVQVAGLVQTTGQGEGED
jgi:hypothetical protein